jgi:hypothetical protein
METGLATNVQGTNEQLPTLTPDALQRSLLRDQYEIFESAGVDTSILEAVKSKLTTHAVSPDLQVQAFIDCIKEIPSFNFLLSQDARILEGYSIEEHTSMVLSQFEKYLKDPKCPIPLSCADLRIAALFHDIGKSLPEKKSDQHIATLEILKRYQDLLPISDKSFAIIESLIGNDPIGKFIVASVETFASMDERTELRQQATAGIVTNIELERFHSLVTFKMVDENLIQRAKEVALSFHQRSEPLGITAKELFNLHRLFYQADTAAYTYDAIATNGRRAFPGLDFLYELDFDANIAQGEALLKEDHSTGMIQHAQHVNLLLNLIEDALV